MTERVLKRGTERKNVGFEWLLGLGAGLLLLYLGTVEARRPVKRQIHADIEVVELGDHFEVLVDNRYGVDITASFDWKQTTHLRPEWQLPRLQVIPGDQTVCVARLWKTRGDPKISVDWAWVYGSAAAVPDLDYVYTLPYAGGQAFAVSQGPGGQVSHTGDSYHAVDFDMPEGTPFCAARGGVVVDLEDNYRYVGKNPNVGGNYVFIRHDDGTVGEYFHLKFRGVAVEIGQRVEAGELLGYTGNTGYSGGPHLHFMVFKARNGHSRESIPLRFKVEGFGRPQVLRQGHVYQAPD